MIACSQKLMAGESKVRIEFDPLHTHATEDGCIETGVCQDSEGCWIGRIVGPMLDCGQLCATRDEAQQWCTRAFRKLFPEHECGPDCDERGEG
jgi:hypothetical protein